MTFAPRFSADGRRAVFSMSVGTGSDIFVTDLGAPGHVQLTRGSSINTAPSFAPDGSGSSSRATGAARSSSTSCRPPAARRRRISFGDGRYATPVWSPRGDMIAFTKIVGGRFHIGAMRVDGSNEKLLTASYIDEGPTWAPNGRVLMFFRETPGGERRAAALLGGHHRAELAEVPTAGFASGPVLVGAAGVTGSPERAGREDRMKKVTTGACWRHGAARCGLRADQRRDGAGRPGGLQRHRRHVGGLGAGGASAAARCRARRSATGCCSRSTRHAERRGDRRLNAQIGWLTQNPARRS